MIEVYSWQGEKASSVFHKLPSLHALAAFEAVARRQSCARAAEELCVTQSAVSHRIRALEEQFGARFVLRSEVFPVCSPDS